MKFRGLDSNGDWQFGQGLGSYAKEADALALNIQTRILSWLGNCFFDLQKGVDWKNRLDKGQRDALIIELNTILMQTDGVIKINSLDVTMDSATRSLSVKYDVQTIYTKSFQTLISNIAGVANV